MKPSRFTLPALALALAAAFPASHAAVTNGGFESSLTGWTEVGSSGLVTIASSLPDILSIDPTEGGSFAVLSNSAGTVALEQTFNLTSGENFLRFDYRLFTDAVNDIYDDSVLVTLTPQAGGPVTLLSLSRNTLQPGGEGPLADFASYDVGGLDIGHTTWQTAFFDVSAYAGQSVTLRFTVDSAGDPDALFESRLALDNVTTSAVPEPGALALIAGALGLFAVGRLRRIARLAS